jgi:hypothetical protein
LKEGHRLRVFKNRVLRRLFGESGRRLRKPFNEELCNAYSFTSIIRMGKSGRMRWAGHVT